MTKKIIFVVLVSAILSLCCGFCFAATTNGENVKLGNEISGSLNKGTDSVRNVADDVIGTGERAVEDMGDAVKNVVNMGENNQQIDRYTTTRTTAQGTQATNGTMSTTTWMWIIFAIAAVIIIAAIWYYALQGNDRD